MKNIILIIAVIVIVYFVWWLWKKSNEKKVATINDPSAKYDAIGRPDGKGGTVYVYP